MFWRWSRPGPDGWLGAADGRIRRGQPHRLSWITLQLQAAVSATTNPQAGVRIRDAVERLDGAIRRIREVVFDMHTDNPQQPSQTTPS